MGMFCGAKKSIKQITSWIFRNLSEVEVDRHLLGWGLIHIKEGTATRSDIVAPKVAEEDKESRPQKT